MNERRTFLKVLGGAAVAMVVPACSSDPASSSSSSSSSSSTGGSSSSSGGTTQLKVADVPEGALVNGPGLTFVGRDAGGLYAMSSLCTHQSCDMKIDGVISATDIFCKCHKSRFDKNGAVLNGPAAAPLVHYKVVVTGDVITIDATAKVSATDRTAV
ncbi:MAG: Rieske (2Fe-2S) protein [Polyangiaceae bacterium]|nr:Rieske (2Fe-2S) protein [Polyangiaceae bacterium]